jgi:hypothetical protein
MAGFTPRKGVFLSRELLEQRLEAGACPEAEFEDTLLGLVVMLRARGNGIGECQRAALGWTLQAAPEKKDRVSMAVARAFARSMPFK